MELELKSEKWSARFFETKCTIYEINKYETYMNLVPQKSDYN